MADELIPWINSAGEGGVRNSMQEFPGNGTNGPFEFNFAGAGNGYIDQSHIKAYRYDPVSAQTYTQTLTFVGPNQVTTSDVIPTGQYVIVYRDTPKDQPLVNYSEGAVMDETNLDKSNEQAVYIAAEMLDRFDAINATSSDAINRSVLAYDTANEALAASGQAVNTANTSAATAGSAVSTANGAVETANAAVATANAAKATAEGIDGKAQSALDASASAVATANAANATANGIDAKATNALTQAGQAVSTANAANATANDAKTTANSVSGKADSAVSTANDAKATAQQAAAGVATAVQKAGDIMSGDLQLKATTGAYSPKILFNSNGYAPFLRSNNASGSGGGIEVVNSANTAVNLTIYDNGDINGRGNASFNNITARGETYAKQRLYLWRDGIYGEMVIRSTDGSCMYIRGRSGGGGMEWVNNAYTAIVAYMEDNGTFHVGNGTMGTDGNVFWTGRGWTSDLWNHADDAWNKANDAQVNRADRNANCQWNSGAVEVQFDQLNGGPSFDLPAPYVCMGFGRVSANSNGKLRGVILRNN